MRVGYNKSYHSIKQYRILHENFHKYFAKAILAYVTNTDFPHWLTFNGYCSNKWNAPYMACTIWLHNYTLAKKRQGEHLLTGLHHKVLLELNRKMPLPKSWIERMHIQLGRSLWIYTPQSLNAKTQQADSVWMRGKALNRLCVFSVHCWSQYEDWIYCSDPMTDFSWTQW